MWNWGRSWRLMPYKITKDTALLLLVVVVILLLVVVIVVLLLLLVVGFTSICTRMHIHTLYDVSNINNVKTINT